MEQVTKFESHNPKLKKEVADYLEYVFNHIDSIFLSKQVLNRFMWTVTENSDSHENIKYLGQPYWSKKAIIHYQYLNTGRKLKDFTDLRHDHSVPKIDIVNEILDIVKCNSKISSDEIFNIFDSKAHAVVITKQEDLELKKIGLNRKLPEDKNPITRYNMANIEIVNVTGFDLKTIKL